MERGEGDDGIEAAVGRPALELRVDDLDVGEARQFLPGEGCEFSAELERDDLEASFGERKGGLAGARADLENPPARWNRPREVGEELVRIGRSHSIVERGDRLERAAKLLASRLMIRKARRYLDSP